jgi:hypothetical protein
MTIAGMPDTTHRPDAATLADAVTLADAELVEACRAVELLRRNAEGRLIAGLIELERRRVYLDDGFRCLAGWGRGVQRWSEAEARSRRDLTKLATVEPLILERLLAGRVGVAQAHLLGRLYCAPRVGERLGEFLELFLDQAAILSYADFEQYVRNWRLLIDQDGADPARAHRDRSLTMSHSDHEFRLVVTGPAIDGIQWRALLRQAEQLEWERDWQTTVQIHRDLACAALMPRSKAQRRYDAFCSLLMHIGGSTTGAGIAVTVDIVVDAQSLDRGIDALFGGRAQRPPAPTRRPGTARCHTFDGIFVDPCDAVRAALTGQVRSLLMGADGRVVAMTRARRLFTGAMRDAVIASASRCTHPGCLVASIDCQIDHTLPYSRGGPTSVDNAGPACRHHNNWRFTSGARIERRADGTWATYRMDGSRVAPPD